MILINIKLTTLKSITVKVEPTIDNEISMKNYINDSRGKRSILTFNQTLQNYLKVSVGDDVYNHSKNDRIQITDTTKIKYPNQAG